MKKTLTIAIVACLALGASAQTGPLGIKAGLNIANLSGTSLSTTMFTLDRKVIPAFYIGMSYAIPINEKLTFQPEIVYSRQGGKTTVDGVIYEEEFNLEMTTKIDYLNVPMVLKYDLGSGFSVDFGMQVGLWLSIENEIKVSTMDITEIETMSDDDSQFLDLAALIGVSYRINQNLDISARWNHGLTNVNSDSDGIKNRVFQIGLGYRF